MNKFLNNTRSTENEIPVSRKIRNTIIILCLGIVLGTFSKFLDNTASNALPFIFEYLDVRNFLGRFAVWLLIALCIAIYLRSRNNKLYTLYRTALAMSQKVTTHNWAVAFWLYSILYYADFLRRNSICPLKKRVCPGNHCPGSLCSLSQIYFSCFPDAVPIKYRSGCSS